MILNKESLIELLKKENTMIASQTIYLEYGGILTVDIELKVYDATFKTTRPEKDITPNKYYIEDK